MIITTNYRKWHSSCYSAFHDKKISSNNTTPIYSRSSSSVQPIENHNKQFDNTTFYFFPTVKERSDSNYNKPIKQSLSTEYRGDDLNVDEVALYPPKMLNYKDSEEMKQTKRDDVKAPWALFFSTTCNVYIIL